MKICSKIASDAISGHRIFKIFSGRTPEPLFWTENCFKCHLGASNTQNFLGGGPPKNLQGTDLLEVQYHLHASNILF